MVSGASSQQTANSMHDFHARFIHRRIFVHGLASLKIRDNLIVSLKDFKIKTISIKFMNRNVLIPNHNRFDSTDLYQIHHPIKHDPAILEFKPLNLK